MLVLSERFDLTGQSRSNPHGLLAQPMDPIDESAIADLNGFDKLAVDGIHGGPWAKSVMA